MTTRDAARPPGQQRACEPISSPNIVKRARKNSCSRELLRLYRHLYG